MKQKLKIQPRIAGTTRISKPSGLLPVVEAGLEAIAKIERRSVSWVKAEIVCAFFGLDSATGKPIDQATKQRRLKGKRVRV